MTNYDKPIIYEDDENTPSPILLVAVNALAIVNIVGAVNALVAVALVNQGISVSNYSTKTTYMKG